ncbi:unnamed protein product [Rhizophagus irregularis]|nr:unnamed protein product [Rhizophagus irregularis]
MFDGGSGLKVQHAELPEVDDELSVSLRIKLKSHYSSWATVFRKGGGESPGNLNVQMHKIKFNDKPLDIGWAIDGEIGNFRYFNWRLSAEEAMKNYLNQRPFC